jgi:polyhydroxyalkanoate synthesis regulator phasin
MANLKGGSYQKQIKDGLYRMGSFGKSRHNSNDHRTHSNKLQEKREMYLKDFAKHLENRNIDTKLNQSLTKENLKSFMCERLNNLSPKTALDYSAGFNSMLKGLKESNITIKEEANTYLKDLTNQNRQEFKNQDYKKDRYINNLNEKIETLQINRLAPP